MASYLVVAHQTLERRELFQQLTAIAERDPEASFELLVPATDPSHLLVWQDGSAAEIASRKVEIAPHLFHDAGLRLARSAVGGIALTLAVPLTTAIAAALATPIAAPEVREDTGRSQT